MPFFKAVIKIWRASRQIKKQFGGFGQDSPFGGFGNFGGSQAREAREEKPRRNKRRKKVFGSKDGEYVDYEEIKEERNVVADTTNTDKYTDDRISDVSFEEIKEK